MIVQAAILDDECLPNDTAQEPLARAHELNSCMVSLHLPESFASASTQIRRTMRDTIILRLLSNKMLANTDVAVSVWSPSVVWEVHCVDFTSYHYLDWWHTRAWVEAALPPHVAAASHHDAERAERLLQQQPKQLRCAHHPMH
jgi:hypothetical protein